MDIIFIFTLNALLPTYTLKILGSVVFDILLQVSHLLSYDEFHISWASLKKKLSFCPLLPQDLAQSPMS